jgi:plasmid stability protein
MQVNRMHRIVPHTGFRMATLQIRDLPDPLHQMLQLRARQHHRSLSQQALSDLQQACGGDGRERRRQALADLQALALAAGTPVFDPSPEELIREDRAR